jgi:hypothetical protein
MSYYDWLSLVRQNTWTPTGYDGQSLYATSDTGQQGDGNKFSYNRMEISDRAAQQYGVNGASGSKVDGLEVYHQFGGYWAHGGRHAVDAVLIQNEGPTNPNNADRFYVGVVGQVISNYGDGGVANGPKGAYFGINPIVQIGGTAYHTANVTGGEFNTFIAAGGGGNRVRYHSGLQIASMIGERGYTYDAAIAVSGINGGQGWRHGLLFGPMNGRNPFDIDSTVMAVSSGSAMTIAAGIDFRGMGFTVAPFLATDLLLSSSHLQLGAASAGVELGNTGGTPYIDFHTTAAPDRDVRLIATGGTGATDAGVLNLYAAGFNLNSGYYAIGGSQVVGPRSHGWAPMTGPGDSVSPMNVYSVSLAQLAMRVSSIQYILTQHGLIGA